MSKPTRLPSGRWRIRWTDYSGKRRSMTCTTWNEAQQTLRRVKVETDAIRAGVAQPPQQVRSFDDLVAYWRAHRLIHKRNPRKDESILRCHLLPSFSGWPLETVDVAAIDRFMAQRTHLAAKTVHNHVTLLLTMLNCAVDLGWLKQAPKVRKPRVHLFSKDYRYLRDDDEVRRLLAAARDEGADTHALYATAIYTGMRQGELAGLRWSDVDLERRLITVQRSFKGPTKGGDVRYVPVLDALLPTLRQWRLMSGRCTLVFPNERGCMHQPSARIFQERLHRVLDAAGFARPPQGDRAVHYVHFHGLRHTFASHWVMKGGDLFKLQKLLGHKSVQMTMRYAHLQPSAFAEDLSRFGGDPLAQGEVLALDRRRDKHLAAQGEPRPVGAA